jgi:hypothetical protein
MDTKIFKARAGDIGGNTLGFYGATFDSTGQFIVAHGYQGALHLWKINSQVYKSIIVIIIIINIAND